MIVTLKNDRAARFRGQYLAALADRIGWQVVHEDVRRFTPFAPS